MSDRARYTWAHGLERNCPVHTRRKKTLMIFVGVSPFRESGSGNVFFVFTDRRMSARWRVGLRHRRIHHTDQPASPRPWAPSEVERGEEPERVVGESDLFEADGGPELQHLVEGNAEDEFDVGLGGLIEQRRQNQSNAPGPVAQR